MSPINGLMFIANKINDIVEKEMSDEGVIKEELMRIQLLFEMDEISVDEYDKREEELLDRLEQIRESKKK